MVKDADKLTFGQHLKVVTPHELQGVLKHPPGRWMTNVQLTYYQGLLLDAPRILFSNPDLEALLHDCQEIIAEITQVCPDLQDSALPNSKLVWYTDGSIFVSDGVC
jgi:hypothetical protein